MENKYIYSFNEALIKSFAMVRVDEMLEKEQAKDDAYLLLQVHDELVYEIRTTRLAELGAKISGIMESVMPPEQSRGVQISVTTKSGLNWGDMRSV